jgi:Caspase domain
VVDDLQRSANTGVFRDADEVDPVISGSGSGRRVIAVIGVDRYRDWPLLSNAVSDARGALSAFKRLGFEELAEPMVNEAATADALRNLPAGKLATLDTTDSLVLFFAGHGHTVTTTYAEGDSVKTGYIVPVDGESATGGSSRWLRLDSWLSDIARLRAQHILVILDACHSGIGLKLTTWRDANLRTEGLAALALRRSRKVITSALDDQRAMDSGPLTNHSLFTGCLIEALDGGIAAHGAVVTGTELGLYLQKRVSSYPASAQTPAFGPLEADRNGELAIQITTTTAVKLAKLQAAQERAEAERKARAGAERAEAERTEAERAEAKRAEAERAEAKRAEAARKERIAAERAAAERARVAAARSETERKARAEAERTEAERVPKVEADRAQAHSAPAAKAREAAEAARLRQVAVGLERARKAAEMRRSEQAANMAREDADARARTKAEARKLEEAEAELRRAQATATAQTSAKAEPWAAGLAEGLAWNEKANAAVSPSPTAASPTAISPMATSPMPSYEALFQDWAPKDLTTTPVPASVWPVPVPRVPLRTRIWYRMKQALAAGLLLLFLVVVVLLPSPKSSSSYSQDALDRIKREQEDRDRQWKLQQQQQQWQQQDALWKQQAESKRLLDSLTKPKYPGSTN